DVGNVKLAHDSHINNNGTGMRIDGGGQATAQVTANTEMNARAEFDNNDQDGIYVANGGITLKGQLFNGMAGNGLTVRTDFNKADGIFCDAKCSLTATYFSASQNNQGFGMTLSTHAASAQVDHSIFTGNKKGGLFVTGTSSTTTFDFGTDASPGAN